jgi:low temperature requirement protein LtrA
MQRLQVQRAMVGRDNTEPHRAPTPLELLFDLCFVVAVSQAVTGLHHFAVEGRFADGVLRFGLVFFAIWWAWVNFSWFASAFDTDDVTYRVVVLVQIAGNLVIAAGIPRFFEHMDLKVMVAGYVIMRLGLVSLWLRVARSDSAAAPTARRYALGVTLVQIGWAAALLVPDRARVPDFVVLALFELSVPIWAERPGMTHWHPGHIAERYGLFTLIVLGESILGATVSIQSAFDAGEEVARLIMIAAGGLLTVFAMWWLYFDQPTDGSLRRFWRGEAGLRESPFLFGYGHLFIFASAAAVGGGLEIAVDYATHHTEISAHQAAAMIAGPVALFLVCIWILRFTLHQTPALKTVMYAIAIALVLASIALSDPVLPIGLVAAALVTVLTIVRWRLESRAAAPQPAD